MPHTRLTSAQITGFWGAWSGWTLDGMDSFIYALVLSPALSELLPKSGYAKTPANVGLAEAWPEDRRKMGAGFLQTGYYFGFFLAAALNYTVGARFGWRAMFLCGLSPVIISILITMRVKEPERWKKSAKESRRQGSLVQIFSAG